MTDLMKHFSDHGSILHDAIRSGSDVIARKLASGDAYIMTAEDVEDRAGGSVFYRTDALSEVTWASWQDANGHYEMAIGVALCGMCDQPLSAYGDCAFCEPFATIREYWRNPDPIDAQRVEGQARIDALFAKHDAKVRAEQEKRWAAEEVGGCQFCGE